MAAGLALTELGRLAGLVETGFLALDDARVTCKEAFPLQHSPKLRIGFDERTGDTVADGAGLAGRPTAVNADAQVVGPLQPGDPKRRHDLVAVTLPGEVVLERAAVEPGRPVAGAQDHARDRRLALARAAVGCELAHLVSSFNGSGLWASCGWSGPA